MNEFTPLSRPQDSEVTVYSLAKECPSEGFNYPTFRLLNKKARLYLSTSLNPQPSISYHLFSVANSRGWFAAVKSAPAGSGEFVFSLALTQTNDTEELLFSRLEDLRSAFSAAKENDETLFNPRRSLSIPTKANILKFACGDTRLLVGLEDGSVIIYDTSSLFTPGTNDVQPLNRTQIQSSPLRQILPNPGTEPNLSELFAVVGNGKVQLLNMRFESQGGWAATDLMSQPIAADWSPKGKHIAIGLQTGDILTFSPTHKSAPNKHIPSTLKSSVLVSLNWLGPSHTFRTSYAAQGETPATQHIVTLDTKSSVVTYFAPDHPFPSYERTTQGAHVLNLPKWDADSGLNEDNKSLTVIGDISSVDLEVLGNVGNQWHRQSQENQLSLPLDKSLDDTILLALESDLTDSTSAQPIMYAYLNDGSVQGWNAEHTKPYLGMIVPNALTSSAFTSQMTAEAEDAGKDTDMDSSTAEPAPAASAFGQSSFSQHQSPFGGRQTTTAFGQTGFGGQSSRTAPAFQSPFGQPSGIFGQSNQSNAPTSTGDSVKPAAGFGAFGSTSTGNAFSGLNSSGSTNFFGSGSFGAANGSPSPPMTREASMSDSTPALGGMSLGSAHPTDPNAVNSMFGSISTTSTTVQQEATSAFGGSLVKPASGFGAFGNFKPSSTFEASKPPAATTTAFGAPSQPSTGSSVFGQSGFSSPAFGKSAFGQPSFGQPSLGAAASPSSGAFSAFATAPSAFGSTSGEADASNRPQPATETKQKTSVFGTPAQSTTPSNFHGDDMESPPGSPKDPFGQSPPSSPEPGGAPLWGYKKATSTPTPSSGGAFADIQVSPSPFKPATGFGAFGSLDTPKSSPFFKKPDETPPPVSAFTPVGSTKPSTTTPGAAFGTPSALGGPTSAFAPIAKPAPTTIAAPTTGGFGAFGGATTGFSAFAGKKTSFSDLLKSSGEETKDPVKGDVFSSKVDVEEEKPKSRTSVFGTPVKKEEETPTVLVFPSPSNEGERQKTEEPELKKEDKPAPEAKDKKTLKSTSTSTLSDEASYANISASSAASSFVDVGEDKGKSVTLEEEEESDQDAEHSGDDRDSFLSDNFSESSYKDGDSANEDSDQEYLPEERESVSPDPSTVPLPLTRSPTATPQELPTIEVSPSTEVDADKSPSGSPPAREPSTTPPTTPIKESKSLFGPSPALATSGPPPAAPPTTPATPGPSAFGLGLGRPSTRPTRSSPLANAVLPADEEEEGAKSPPKHAQPAISPRPVFGVLPVDSEIKKEEESVDEAQHPSNKRPKTPPLLSTMAPPTPVPNTPVLAPATPSVATTKTGAPGALPFGFVKQPTATASTPNLSGKGFENDTLSPTLSKPDLTRAATAPPAPGLTSLFGTAPSAPPASTTTAPTFSMPPFSLNSAKSPTLFPAGGHGIFGAAKSPPLPPTPGQVLFGAKAAAFPPLPAGGPFGQKPTTASPTQSIFGAPSPGTGRTPSPTPSSKPMTPPTPAQTPPEPTPEEILEEGMQKECASLVNLMNKELFEIGQLAREAPRRRHEAGTSAGGSRNKADLGVASKWSLGDLTQFKQVLLQYEADLEDLSSYREKGTKMLRELQSNMLKAATRKEEIARFNKAKNDKEFSKLLRARTLGPEHSETQAHLRKSIRIIRDRVQKLESRLRESKKRLTQAASCKPTFRAPSLDTINRTYRNIEIAIDQQSEEVARLATRIAKLKVEDSASSPDSRDARLPDVARRRLDDVIPDVQVRTAAALNAEVVAGRLKKALLAARKEPLLNAKAASGPSAPFAFNTPQKISNKGSFASPSSMPGPLFGGPAAPTMTPTSIPIPDWDNLPEDNFNPGASTAPQGRRGATGQRKHQSVPLKRSTGTTAPVTPPPTDFQWGPLPSFPTPPPSTSLPKSFVPFSIVKK